MFEILGGGRGFPNSAPSRELCHIVDRRQTGEAPSTMLRRKAKLNYSLRDAEESLYLDLAYLDWSI